MRISIATRVTIACVIVLVLSVSLVAAGFRIGRQVQDANARVNHLSRLLRAQDREDRAQRAVRLALGDITRTAERGAVVPDARWTRSSAELDGFAALSAASPVAGADMPPALRPVLAGTRAAALAFVPTGRDLLAIARRDPAAIKGEMPRFLDALKRLEAERTRAREALGHAIEEAVDANIRFTRRSTIRLFAGALGAVLILFVTAVWLRLRLIAPIVAIAAKLRDFDSDRPDAAAVPGRERADELGDLARGLYEYRDAVEQRRIGQRRIDFLAHHDALTGLPNRLLFESRLSHELVRSRRTGDSIALFAIDMDGFKEINDRHGHAGGDDALRRVTRLLLDCVRAEDLVARIGGDEFAIIQAGAPQPAAARSLIYRLSKATAETADADISIRMSIGVAISAPDQDGDELSNAADAALYRAKSDGRNTARFFDSGLQAEISLGRRLARDLEHAIARRELAVVFHPVATTGLDIVGYEAALRWRHPELGEIAPERFLPLAESTGQIARIGAWMAERAVEAAAAWDPAAILSLDLFPVQFRDPALGGDLLALAERHGVAPERLQFEVAERATLGHLELETLATLRRLKEAGARIAMDDFGTGPASLSNLRNLQFDALKIDAGFVAAMLTDPPSAAIVRATIGLGRSLNLRIVAQGVDTAGQLDRLREWGCDQVQGACVGRPSPPAITGAAPGPAFLIVDAADP